MDQVRCHDNSFLPPVFLFHYFDCFPFESTLLYFTCLTPPIFLIGFLFFYIPALIPCPFLSLYIVSFPFLILFFGHGTTHVPIPYIRMFSAILASCCGGFLSGDSMA
ncbi:hypothetical protein ASPWEDRAFT_326591 [Aspergillus wentii DTO 134E9]|uniref:Uncharacterized protein n=1 Tax=Aspergillus wentii DTO 134E9 TaxID=1073089 RepID=A0A1L9RUB4_ASPWE|nr:uncharacterized protein ASPWEDRAFT_326591 [Aspergillus wentii DTO 134E9]OJJ38515.1 hypothetical protein ASPWEDRAFT_326591 [Aspergillus wentii DTO 134E9]